MFALALAPTAQLNWPRARAPRPLVRRAQRPRVMVHTHVLPPSSAPFSTSPHQYATPVSERSPPLSSHAAPLPPIGFLPAWAGAPADGGHALRLLEEDGCGGGHWSQRKSETGAPLTTASVTANCQWLGRCARVARRRHVTRPLSSVTARSAARPRLRTPRVAQGGRRSSHAQRARPHTRAHRAQYGARDARQGRGCARYRSEVRARLLPRTRGQRRELHEALARDRAHRRRQAPAQSAALVRTKWHRAPHAGAVADHAAVCRPGR